MSNSDRNETLPQTPDDDGEWFRAPTRREQIIGAWLFVGFGLFFFASMVVLRGWWFRYVILILGVISTLRGLRHAMTAYRMKQTS